MKNLLTKFNNTTPGYAIKILKKNEIIFEQCIGLANLNKRTPITSETAFRTASLTKQFTAMAIMLLCEKRLLDFDDPLEKFFSDFPAYENKITVRQLLTHTSGIPDHEKPLYRKIKPGEKPTIYDALAVLKKQKTLLFPAGSQSLYSNAGYVLLALIIEKVSGKKYATFLEENIFTPLKLKNTKVLDETIPAIKNRAIGYKKTKNTWEVYDYDPLNYIVGDEGIYSSIDDLVQWYKGWTSNILISDKTLIKALNPAIFSNRKNGEYGFSWKIEKWKENKVLYQTGTWVGFANIVCLIPKKKITFIFLSNTNAFSQKQRISLTKKMISEIN